MGRLLIITLFTIGCLYLVHRQKFTHNQTVFYPGEAASNVNSQIKDPLNYYRTGKYQPQLAPIPKWNLENPLGFIDILSRKKINGFMFTQYNMYKLEINFIDLGYSSIVQIHYWTEDVGHLTIQQKVGFSLSENFNQANLNLDIKKRDFKLTVRQTQRIGKNGVSQTVTNFNVTAHQQKVQLDVSYTHIKRDDQCMTAVRNGVISHKCYGGYGYGKVKINSEVFDEEANQNKKKMSAFNPKTNLTRCSFDGFRGSGFDWKWTWIYGSGFSKLQFYAKGHTIQKQRWIGFNFGSLYNKSQDFLFLNGKIYPVQGLKYVVNEKFPVGKNITVTSKHPQINMNLNVMHRTKTYEDLGIFKNDMVKAQGHWAGYIIDPENITNKIQFYQIAGLIESAHLII